MALVEPRTTQPYKPDASRMEAGLISLWTLSLIRWVVIAGQLAAVLTVHYVLNYPLPIGPAIAVIGVSVLLNLAAIAQGRTRVRLGDRDATLYLSYDILQFTALLYLTGGLSNPFSPLLLAPLTAAATILRWRSVLWLTLLVLAATALLAVFSMPLPRSGGPGLIGPFRYGFLYAFGLWIALSVAALFIAGYVWRISAEARRLERAYAASQAALAREQRLAALGGLAAAAAHELGTPLATISLVARELERTISADSPEGEDVALLVSQAERCRQILAELSAGPEQHGEHPFETMALPVLVDLAAAPHRIEGIDFAVTTEGAGEPPVFRRTPELIHALGALLQNAFQFARRRVTAAIDWNEDEITLTIQDDGPGIPPQLLAKLGEPYLSGRKGRDGHMGLGIFIAASLLEREGATLTFSSGPGGEAGGAQVVIAWPIPTLESFNGGSNDRSD